MWLHYREGGKKENENWNKMDFEMKENSQHEKMKIFYPMGVMSKMIWWICWDDVDGHQAEIWVF